MIINSKQIRNRALLMLVVFVILFAPIFFIKIKNSFEKNSRLVSQPPPVIVAVVKAKNSQWAKSLKSIGSLVADQGIDVTAPLPGTTIKIHFNSGQKVTKGQPLISQDIGIPAAELRGLEATANLRKLELKRAKKLFDRALISRSDLDSAEAISIEASAKVNRQKAFIERKTVYAPFDGRLGIRLIDLGSYLNPGDPIVPLYKVSPIHVNYSVPEKHLLKIVLEQRVNLTVSAYPEQVFVGSVSAINPVIDIETRNIQVRATFKNEDGLLKPGMFAEIETVSNDKRDIVELPSTSVTYTPYGSSVYLIEKNLDNFVVKKKQIKVGEKKGQLVEIISGVNEGDLVVSVGQNKLRNGMRVSIQNIEES